MVDGKLVGEKSRSPSCMERSSNRCVVPPSKVLLVARIVVAANLSGSLRHLLLQNCKRVRQENVSQSFCLACRRTEKENECSLPVMRCSWSEPMMSCHLVVLGICNCATNSLFSYLAGAIHKSDSY